MQVFLSRKHAKFSGQVLQHVVNAESPHVRRHAARIQSRNVQQPCQQAFRGTQRTIDVDHGFAILRVLELLAERMGEQVCCVQRLRQVVADRHKESRLGAIGALGLPLGAFQLGGARDHALFQRFGNALELRFGATECGDIGEGRDESSAGHGIAADLDHAFAEATLSHVRRARAHMGDAFFDFRRDAPGLVRISCEVVSQQFGHRNAYPQQAGGVVEQFRIAPVPRHQAQVGIDHADALAHVFQCCFQHALVEAQCLRGFTDNRGHGVEVAALFTTRGIQQQARRGGAEHCRQFAFNALLHGGRHFARAARFSKHGAYPVLGQETRCNFLQALTSQAGESRDCRCGAAPRCVEPGHQRARDQAQRDRARQAAPVFQAQQTVRRNPRQAERTFAQPRARCAKSFSQRRH